MRRAGLRTCKQLFQVEFREEDRFQNEKGLPTEIFWPDRPFEPYDEVAGFAGLANDGEGSPKAGYANNFAGLLLDDPNCVGRDIGVQRTS